MIHKILIINNKPRIRESLEVMITGVIKHNNPHFSISIFYFQINVQIKKVWFIINAVQLFCYLSIIMTQSYTWHCVLAHKRTLGLQKNLKISTLSTLFFSLIFDHTSITYHFNLTKLIWRNKEYGTTHLQIDDNNFSARAKTWGFVLVDRKNMARYTI